MLKFNKISLAKNAFTPVELAHLAGKATITIAGDTDTVINGRFHMSNGGRCTMCAIDAAMQSLVGGEGDDKNNVAPIAVNKPSNVTVELNATMKRSFLVPAEATKVNTDCEELQAVDGANCVLLNGSPLSVSKVNGKFEATLPSAAATNRTVELELKVKVGAAAAEDNNVAHKLQIMPDNPEGLLHFSIVAPVADVEDRNLNKATFEVRGAKPWKVLGEKPIVSFVVPPATPV